MTTSDDNFFRALTYNIHKGYRPGNRIFVLDEIRNNIRKTGAHLVFLQEVFSTHENDQKNEQLIKSQFEFLAESIWPHFAYGKNAVYRKGHHGNAILSLYSILSWKNLDLSTNRWEKRGLCML